VPKQTLPPQPLAVTGREAESVKVVWRERNGGQ